MISRGEIWWADLAVPTASDPGYRRPVLVVSDDAFNRSRIGTVVAVTLSSNTALAAAPGNVELLASASGLAKDSVVNVSQVITLAKRDLSDKVGDCPLSLMRLVDDGLAIVLGLSPH